MDPSPEPIGPRIIFFFIYKDLRWMPFYSAPAEMCNPRANRLGQLSSEVVIMLPQDLAPDT